MLRFLELVVADHTHYAWHEAVKDEKLAAAVGAIARGLGKCIVEVKDAHGRKAYSSACAECRKAVDDALLFCGRFELIEKLHRSATCVVWLALDVRSDSVRVVVKFMRNKDQSDREVMEREGLDGAFVVGLVATSEELGELLECTIGDEYCTAAAPASPVLKGRVMYEVTIHKMASTIQLIGWATPEFTQGEFTGYNNGHSWAVDGMHRQAYHKSHNGEPFPVKTWAAGDVIGVAADLDNGTLSWAKNGEWLEVFRSCNFGSGGIFPSISGGNFSYEVNLGGAAFQYPKPSYKPAAPGARRLVPYHENRLSSYKGSFDESVPSTELWKQGCERLGHPECEVSPSFKPEQLPPPPQPELEIPFPI